MITLMTMLIAGTSIVAATEPTTPEPQWRRGAFRINTLVSSGDESIDTVAIKAEKAGLDFIVVTDQYLVRCEYGAPPFRNVFKVTKRQNSALDYGIDRYLTDIRQTRSQHPDLSIIAGVDIAPYYYWTGAPWRDNLRLNQYSEQLTVFGPEDEDFYANIPVIHNEPWDFHPLRVATRLSPLILIVIGVLFLAAARRPVYADQQGNAYRRRSWGKVAAGGLLIILGGLWTLDNRPFTAHPGHDQYEDAGARPFQQVIDHVRREKGAEAGIIWSAPEATMRMAIFGVGLLTAPYLDDVVETEGHNGFAGVYGDANTAMSPGGVWDQLLLDYCVGKRDHRPVIVGEADYHGRKPIDMIQTVVLAKEKGEKGVYDALVKGRSYAVVKKGPRFVDLTDATLTSNGAVARLGETLAVDGGADVELHVSGNVEGKETKTPLMANLTVVVDGAVLVKETINVRTFNKTFDVGTKMKTVGTHYVRFSLEGRDVGVLRSNPIFLQRR